MNFRQALDNNLMNSVSSSLSVYHGPPVTDVEGSRWKRMYVFRVGYYHLAGIFQSERNDSSMNTYLDIFDCFDELLL